MLKIAFSEIYAHHLPEKHRFPMLKYELLPKQLMHEGVVVTGKFFLPQKCFRKGYFRNSQRTLLAPINST